MERIASGVKMGLTIYPGDLLFMMTRELVKVSLLLQMTLTSECTEFPRKSKVKSYPDPR